MWLGQATVACITQSGLAVKGFLQYRNASTSARRPANASDACFDAIKLYPDSRELIH